MSTGGGLKLAAEDSADLEVISAAAQDGLVRVSGLLYDKRARRFTMMIDRFRWELQRATPPYERVNSAVSFEGVLGVKTKRIRRHAPNAVAALLSLQFTPTAEPPGGTVVVHLAGGGEIALDVECVDCALLDIGAPWRTPRKPDHGE